MNVAIITQEDRFFTPRNVALICSEPGIRVREIIVLDSKGSLVNMRRRLLRWFGPAAAARMAFSELRLAVRDIFSRATGYEMSRPPASLRAVARGFNVKYSVEANANDSRVLERLHSYDLDAVVSFSAPQVFKPELLSMPRLGCFNLHCSLLPRYRGLLPSFWVLYHGEPRTGATVHLMDFEIDNGGILGQVEVDIREFRTMREVLQATKIAGGELMLRVLRDARDGTLNIQPNRADEGDYYTWPTNAQADEFRRRGYRLA
jgi:methionyl-tRNA formyltransferase